MNPSNPITDRAQAAISTLESDSAAVVEAGPDPSGAWIRGADEEAILALEAVGLREERRILQLRRTLPYQESPKSPDGFDTRRFEASDGPSWLECNNAAFAWHPEQSNWDQARLDAALAQPWVDLAGFLVCDDDHGVGGFVWTRIHPASSQEPAIGEIYVIGVHPRNSGRGWGTALVIAGLSYLSARNLAITSLWVEATNAPALRMYAKLGYQRWSFDSLVTDAAPTVDKPTA